MSIPTVILAPRVTDDSVTIWKACLTMGWNPLRLQGWRVPENLRTSTEPILIYGEPLFAEAVSDQLGLALLEPPIDWLVHLPYELVWRRISIMSLKEARRLEGRAFFKPADGKVFEARVYERGIDLPDAELVDQSLLVLRSEIVDFQLEVRCIVRDAKLVTQSPYWRNGELAQDSEGRWTFGAGEGEQAATFACRVLSDSTIKLPPACTLDVGRLATGEWAIIEANPIWGAGLYGGDPKEVLMSIREAIVPKAAMLDQQRQWQSRRAGQTSPAIGEPM